MSPSPHTEAAYVRVLGEERLDGVETPAPATHPPLPSETTAFVGRGAQLATLRGLLQRSRLVTVTGMGGVGKSRVAVEAARQLEDGADRVVLVELASLAEPELLVPHVAGALGLRDEAGPEPLAVLVAHLRSVPTLLVLDNCEHLVEATASLVARLLRGCPALRVLATSQAPLSVAGESILALTPLELPPAEPASLDEVHHAEAVRLFVDRARSVLADFTLEPADVAAVAEICCRLDGIPLALELAAAWVPVLSVAEIAARLDDRLELLSSGPRTGPERHRSLHAALDWSNAGLTGAERTLFRRLAVFAGGFSFDAMVEVCIDEGIGAPPLQVLSSLVAKSLLQAELRAAGSRYRLLETVRHYASDRLAEAGEADRLRQRLGAWATALAERAESGLEGPDQRWWLDVLDVEHANLRAALAWPGRSVGQALRLATALGRFWEVRGHRGEGRAWLAGALREHDAQVPTGSSGDVAAVRARALDVAAVLAQRQGDRDDALARYGESLVIHRSLGDRLGEAVAVHGLGNLAVASGDLAEAQRCYRHSLALGRELGAPQVVATVLTTLGGMAQRQADLDRAWSLLREALEIQRANGLVYGAAWSLSFLGQVAESRGELDHARPLYEESFELRRVLGDRSGIAESLARLGSLAMHQGELARARSMHHESLQVRRQLGDAAGAMESLRHLGDVARHQGDHDRAADLYHQSLALALGLHDTCCVARARLRLALVARARGERVEALRRYGEAVAAGSEAPADDLVAEWLEGIGGVAVEDGQAETGARLLGAAESRRRAVGAPVPPAERRRLDSDVERARRALGDDGWEAARRAGWALSEEESMATARVVLG